jgi:hypothetical protein
MTQTPQMTGNALTIFILYNFSFLGLGFWLFWAARAIFQLFGDCHHYWWQDCKYRHWSKFLSLHPIIPWIKRIQANSFYEQ